MAEGFSSHMDMAEAQLPPAPLRSRLQRHDNIPFVLYLHGWDPADQGSTIDSDMNFHPEKIFLRKLYVILRQEMHRLEDSGMANG